MARHYWLSTCMSGAGRADRASRRAELLVCEQWQLPSSQANKPSTSSLPPRTELFCIILLICVKQQADFAVSPTLSLVCLPAV